MINRKLKAYVGSFVITNLAISTMFVMFQGKISPTMNKHFDFVICINSSLQELHRGKINLKIV